ncbi:DsbA family protein [Pedobacter arcticus]|uniref:DsbA family protein n=1 Tax=Pedobacter arcticus TaxID=752140 RepID=UPI0002EC706C|nr:DsbA family protein [Pedobacter arcticus]
MVKRKLEIIYVYDALCGWCYGFSGVMSKLYQQYKNEFDFEVLSGGMILGDREGPISDSAELIKTHTPRLQETTGVVFGEGFWKVLEEGTQFQSSEKPAIALAVFKSFFPEQAVLFAADLQKAKYTNGVDLSLDESYLPIIEQYGIATEDFLQKLNSEEFKKAAYYEFALAKQLQVSGYPAAFIKVDDRNFHMIAKGYADYETMELRISNVLKEVS